MKTRLGKRRRARRDFLAAAGGAVTLGFPSIVTAQAPVTLRMQSTWLAKDILHEYALDFAKKLNDMSGGELRIDVLPAGTVATAFGALEMVSKGELDACHGTLGHHYGRHPAVALWGSGAAFGMDANTLLAWHHFGGGRALLEKLY